MGKTIEIFTDRSRFTDELEKQVQDYACPKCSILVYDASSPEQEPAMNSKAAEYGIETLPAVTLDGKQVPLDQLRRGSISKLVRQLFHK